MSGRSADTLASLAVVQTNLGDPAAAVAAVRTARELVGDSWHRS